LILRLVALGVRVKLSVVAVTVRLTVVVSLTAPEVPVTVTATGAVVAAISAVVWMIRVEVVELVELKLQVAPAGKVEATQLKVTVPVKPLCGVIVMVVGALLFPATAVTDPGLGASVKPLSVAAQAMARLLASTEPRPVTRL
jgi:hypothetical protein